MTGFYSPYGPLGPKLATGGVLSDGSLAGVNLPTYRPNTAAAMDKGLPLDEGRRRQEMVTVGTVAWPPNSALTVTAVGLSHQQRQWLAFAIKVWQQGLAGRLTLALNPTETPTGGATIQVTLTDQPLPREAVSGWCKRQLCPQGRWLVGANIMMVQPVIDGETGDMAKASQRHPEWMRAARWQRTLLHELGHALGLEHSQTKQDLMFYHDCPTLWQAHTIGPDDRAQLLNRYGATV